MNIGGLNPLSMIDFPGTPSAVVFTNGCQLECPFCHNPLLAKGISPQIPEQEVKEFLKSRVGKLQGVVISGGEPTLQPDLLEFCKFCKDLGYKVKVDTNGRDCGCIMPLWDAEVVDYVAVDLKLTTEDTESLSFGEQTLSMLLMTGLEEGEVRATCVRPFIKEEGLLAWAKSMPKTIPIYLQHCNVTPESLNPEFFESGKGKPWTQEEIYNFVEKYGKQYNVKAR